MSHSTREEYHNKHARLCKWMAQGFKQVSILVDQILLSNLLTSVDAKSAPHAKHTASRKKLA
jgi:hypothetical protein